MSKVLENINFSIGKSGTVVERIVHKYRLQRNRQLIHNEQTMTTNQSRYIIKRYNKSKYLLSVWGEQN